MPIFGVGEHEGLPYYVMQYIRGRGLDAGDGPVSLRVNGAARPCAWMDVTVGPGAWKALRTTGGIRCTPLNDGVLRIGPVEVTVERVPAS